MDVKLNKNVRYVPFMDRRCAEKAKEDYNKHFIYIVVLFVPKDLY